MFLPSRDGFLTVLQSDRAARVSVTAGDDLAVVVDAIRTLAATLGVDVRIFLGDARTLNVVVREPDVDVVDAAATTSDGGGCHAG